MSQPEQAESYTPVALEVTLGRILTVERMVAQSLGLSEANFEGCWDCHFVQPYARKEVRLLSTRGMEPTTSRIARELILAVLIDAGLPQALQASALEQLELLLAAENFDAFLNGEPSHGQLGEMPESVMVRVS